jgi:MFS family permease
VGVPKWPPLLGIGDFRGLAASTLVNSIGMMGEVVVLGWLALELTNSPFLVGVAMGARSLPLFFVGLPAGILADRVSRQRLLMATSAGQGVTSAALGVLALLGVVTLGHVLLLTFIAGVIRAVEHAARQSYAHDVVGPAGLVRGLAILGVAMRAGWLVGSLGTGAVIARFGTGMAYVAVAVAFLAGAVVLLPASSRVATSSSRGASERRGVLDFVTSLRSDRVLPVLMMLTAAGEIFGFSHQALLPSLARDVLRVGPEGLGALNAARSLGGILGLVAVSLRSTAHGGAMLLAILIAFGASLIGLGIAPSLVGFVGVLVVVIVVNAVGALADLLAQSLMQLGVPPELRGRAGGAWVVSVGLAPLGQLQIGALASLVGVGFALGASGLALVALGCASALAFPRVRKL